MRFVRAVVAWLATVVYQIRHGEEDLDAVYPDRHHATQQEIAVTVMVNLGITRPMGF